MAQEQQNTSYQSLAHLRARSVRWSLERMRRETLDDQLSLQQLKESEERLSLVIELLRTKGIFSESDVKFFYSSLSSKY